MRTTYLAAAVPPAVGGNLSPPRIRPAVVPLTPELRSKTTRRAGGSLCYFINMT